MDFLEYKIEQITMILGIMLISNLAIAFMFFRGMNLWIIKLYSMLVISELAYTFWLWSGFCLLLPRLYFNPIKWEWFANANDSHYRADFGTASHLYHYYTPIWDNVKRKIFNLTWI